MIRVELLERVDDVAEHVVAGALTVDDAGTYRFEGNRDAFPTYLTVPVPTETGMRQVAFDDDPAQWARNLGGLLRSGYLFARVTHDDAGGELTQ